MRQYLRFNHKRAFNPEKYDENIHFFHILIRNSNKFNLMSRKQCLEIKLEISLFNSSCSPISSVVKI